MDNTFEGYKNRNTFLTALYFANEHDLYKQKLQLYTVLGNNELTAMDVYTLYLNVDNHALKEIKRFNNSAIHNNNKSQTIDFSEITTEWNIEKDEYNSFNRIGG